LATAIDDAFARWDRAHLHMFDLGEHGGLLIDRYWDDPPERARLDETARLGTLAAGQQFVYVFDLGDDWAHLCTVADQRIDPQDPSSRPPRVPRPEWRRRAQAGAGLTQTWEGCSNACGQDLCVGVQPEAVTCGLTSRRFRPMGGMGQTETEAAWRHE